ncbi:MAG: hypothetical protein Q8L74_16540 [Nitrospirota bacterium]|nr:hypothetical protein [Nitrospirota bacterium]MDP2384532.1 hypothetical protein [Nitrospirota bacterium]
MHKRMLIGVIGILAFLLPSMRSAGEPFLPPIVEVPGMLHFTAADGTDVTVPPGTYHLTASGTSLLQLTPPETGPSLLIQASPTTHDETIVSPTALVVVIHEDEQHLLLLLPDHTALDARGSHSGVRSRAGDFSALALSPRQINRAITLQPLGANGPSAPIPISPSQGAIFTNPTLRIQWQMGPGSPDPTRYEICVSEATQPCPGPTAVLFKSVGAPLREPLLQPQLGLGSQPGAPGFQPPPGAPGPAPFFHTVTLPYQFQGKRLRWSVTTCVPYSVPGTVSRLAQNETCVASEPRALTWMLPAPTLTLPLDNTALATTDRQRLLAQPSFAWNYASPQGVDYFLVCIFKPGMPCPTQPGVQPFTLVAQVQGPGPFTLLQDLTPFLGQPLHWTVAACNATLGCTYQPQYWRIHIPVTDGSFEALYQITQQPKCLNCHQFHRENDTYLRHIQLGRFTRAQVPASSMPNGAAICSTCHTAATGFVNNWIAPNSRKSFERSLQDVCSTIVSSFNVGLSTTTEEHLLKDPIIMWAADRIPGLGQSRWRELAQRWMDGYNWRGGYKTRSRSSDCSADRGTFTPRK